MTTTMLVSDLGAVKTTDGVRFGSDQYGRGRRAEPALVELTDELSTAMSDAYWSYMLQGELEDAFDSALLRAAMADTPILTGMRPVWTL